MAEIWTAVSTTLFLLSLAGSIDRLQTRWIERQYQIASGEESAPKPTAPPKVEEGPEAPAPIASPFQTADSRSCEGPAPTPAPLGDPFVLDGIGALPSSDDSATIGEDSLSCGTCYQVVLAILFFGLCYLGWRTLRANRGLQTVTIQPERPDDSLYKMIDSLVNPDGQMTAVYCQIEELMRNCKSAETEKEEERSRAEKLEKKFKNLETEKEEERSRANGMKITAHDMHQRAQKDEAAMLEEKSRADGLRLTVDNMTRNRQSTHNKVRKAKEATKKAECTASEMCRKAETAHKKAKETKEKLQKVRTEKEDAAASAKILADTKAEMIKSLEKQLEHAVDRVKQAQSGRDEAQARCRSLESSLKDEQDKAENDRMRAEASEERAEAIQTAKDEAVSIANEAMVSVDRALEAKETAQTEAHDTRKRLWKIEDDLRLVKRTLKSSIVVCEEAQAGQRTYKERFEGEQETSAALREQLKKLQEETLTARSAERHADEELGSVHKKLETAQSEASTLHQKLDSMQQEKSELEVEGRKTVIAAIESRDDFVQTSSSFDVGADTFQPAIPVLEVEILAASVTNSEGHKSGAETTNWRNLRVDDGSTDRTGKLGKQSVCDEDEARSPLCEDRQHHGTEGHQAAPTDRECEQGDEGSDEEAEEEVGEDGDEDTEEQYWPWWGVQDDLGLADVHRHEIRKPYSSGRRKSV